MKRESEVRKRVTHMAREVLVLKKSIAKIEKSMKLLLACLDMSDNAVVDACEQIDFHEFRSQLSFRACRSLEKAGVVDSISLARLTVDRLCEVKNCGETTVAEVQNLLAEYGVAMPVDD